MTTLVEKATEGEAPEYSDIRDGFLRRQIRDDHGSKTISIMDWREHMPSAKKIMGQWVDEQELRILIENGFFHTHPRLLVIYPLKEGEKD